MNKKFLIVILIIVIFVAGILMIMKKNKSDKPLDNEENESEEIVEEIKKEDMSDLIEKDKKSLVLYFSATGNTKHVAETISKATSSNILEIVPKESYTNDDLNYNDNDSRANKEQNDKNSRPEIEDIYNVENYDVIYLGYPIWWGDVPKVILTLLDSYNMDNKTIIPFCTSGSSGISQSMNTLKEYNKNVNWIEGKRFSNSVTEKDIKEWVKNLDIVKNIDEKEENKMYVKVNGEILTATLESNSSVDSLKEKLKQGDITINMHDYSNFEKVGELGFSLPRNDTNITTTAGDIILYQGNQITIYYDTNSWNFTKLGHIDNITQNELKQILGDDDVTVVLSLEK